MGSSNPGAESAKAKSPRGRPSSRDAMLDAAQQVALQQGAAKLTLDAVARHAGVSKGGLIYNFPTKTALLLAMIERVVEHNQKAHRAAIARLADVPGRNLRAYVMNSVKAPDTDDRVSGALLAEIISEPALRESAAAYFARRFELLADGSDFELAALVHLATEGLWILELLQLSPFSKAERARVVRSLLAMVEAPPK